MKARTDVIADYNSSQKHRDAQTRWRRANPRAKRDEHYRLRYGLTLAEYEERVERCGNRCECCGRAETTRDHRTGTVRSLSVDHDHATGDVRGLLCRRCNWLIGELEAGPAIYDDAMRYLNEHSD